MHNKTSVLIQRTTGKLKTCIMFCRRYSRGSLWWNSSWRRLPVDWPQHGLFSISKLASDVGPSSRSDDPTKLPFPISKEWQTVSGRTVAVDSEWNSYCSFGRFKTNVRSRLIANYGFNSSIHVLCWHAVAFIENFGKCSTVTTTPRDWRFWKGARETL